MVIVRVYKFVPVSLSTVICNFISQYIVSVLEKKLQLLSKLQNILIILLYFWT